MKQNSLIIFLLCGLVIANPTLAAEPADEPGAAETETADPISEEDADAALEEEIRAADQAAASNSAPAAADRNESFVPTVQISEDLSVSFPVDI